MSRIFFLLSLFPFIGELCAAVEDTVEGLTEAEGLTGDAKRIAVVKAARTALDELDSIPVWADMGEAARDRILDGLVEISYQALKVSKAPWKRKAAKTKFAATMQKARAKITQGAPA